MLWSNHVLSSFCFVYLSIDRLFSWPFGANQDWGVIQMNWKRNDSEQNRCAKTSNNLQEGHQQGSLRFVWKKGETTGRCILEHYFFKLIILRFHFFFVFQSIWIHEIAGTVLIATLLRVQRSWSARPGACFEGLQTNVAAGQNQLATFLDSLL